MKLLPGSTPARLILAAGLSIVSARSVSAALPLLPEQIAVTCFSGTVNYYSSPPTVTPNVGSNGYVVAQFDTTTGNIGPLIPPTTSPPRLWSAPGDTPPFSGFHNETGLPWNAQRLGEVFGITVDDAAPPNLYITATEAYNIVGSATPLPKGPGGAGGVYRLDGTTGASSFGSLPNNSVNGPGLGNVCFHRAGSGTGYLYVSDLEDGKIYRMNANALVQIGSPFDHGVQARPNESLSPINDDGTAGLTQFGRRVWGLKTYQSRLYYAVWWEDSRNISLTESNEIWSVDLDNNGDFLPLTAKRRFSQPNFSVYSWSHPAASIDFSPTGTMFLAERYWQYLQMIGNATFGAHHTRILRYWLSGTNWVTDPSPTHQVGGDPSIYFGNSTPGANSAGGVAVNCDNSVWATGDQYAGSYSTPPNMPFGLNDLGYVYGCLRIPSGGNSMYAGLGYGSFAIDYDGNTNSIAKFGVGAIATVRNCCVAAPSGLVGWWTLDEPSGAGVYPDLSGAGNNALVESGGPVGSFGSPFATPGKVAGAQVFINASTRGRASNSPSLNFGTGSFSADAWFKAGPPALPTTWRPIVDKFNPATSLGYTVGITNNRLAVIVGNGTASAYLSANSVSYGPWNFLGVAVDRTLNKVFFHVNGTNEAAQTLVPTGNYNSTLDLLLGSAYDTNTVTEMTLDEIELFNRALAGNEFTAIYNADRGGKCKSGQNPSCSNSVVKIVCPTNLTVACAPVVYYPPPSATTTCGTITNLTCTPPSGSTFPIGPTLVTCTATDVLGNSATCTFTITVQPDTVPPVIDCACLINHAHEALEVVSCKATVPDFCLFYPCFSDNCCLKGCSQSPPAGTIVGPGTYPITVTITDCAGNTNTNACVLNFVVTKPSTGCETPCIYCPKSLSVTGCPPVMPDFSTNGFTGPNCVPAGPLLVMQSIPPGTPLTVGTPVVVILQVCDANGICRACDVAINPVSNTGNPTIICPPNQVVLSCASNVVFKYKVSAGGYNGPVICTPPSGSMFPQGVTLVTCKATNNCGGIATCTFTVTVKPPPGRWACPPKQLGIGTPYDLVGGATMALCAIAPGNPGGPGICIFPNPLPSVTNSGVLLQPGTAQAITFTTTLDFTAPVGSGFDLALPPDPLHPNDPPILSMHSKGAKGYCVKSMKRYADDPGSSMRAYVVNTNGDLLDPLTFTPTEVASNGVFDIGFQPGVTNCHVTIEVDLKTGAVSVEFAGPTTLSSERKGWDGCIYGPDRPVKKPTSRVTMIPPLIPGAPPITELYLYVSGWSEMGVAESSLTATSTGRKWGDGHVTLMKAYDDGDSVEFVSVADGGGVVVDLGHSESFDLRLTKFETNVITGEELLTRTLGPISSLTNQQQPPFLDAFLLKSSDTGVDCSADFSNLESPTVHVLIYSAGVLVAERTGVTGQLGQPLFTLPTWPTRLGKLGGSTPCRRGKIAAGLIILPAGGGLPPTTVLGDEFRVLAETSPGTPLPDYYSGFEFIVSDGADWGVSELQRTLACAPVPLHLTRSSDGLLVSWEEDGFRLQGAVAVNGPWFDLGVSSPAVLGNNHAARYLRLVCE